MRRYKRFTKEARDEDILNHFFAQFEVRDNGCWEWTGTLSGGRGRFSYRNKQHLAYRVSYELFAGPIPNGLELDHLCRNPLCINPDHLEPVTHQTNLARGFWAMKTHCPHGHAYTPENTRRHNGNGRLCVTCDRIRKRAAYAASKRTS